MQKANFAAQLAEKKGKRAEAAGLRRQAKKAAVAQGTPVPSRPSSSSTDPMPPLTQPPSRPASSSTDPMPPLAQPPLPPPADEPPQQPQKFTAATLVDVRVFEQAILRLKPPEVVLTNTREFAESQMTAARMEWVQQVAPYG